MSSFKLAFPNVSKKGSSPETYFFDWETLVLGGNILFSLSAAFRPKLGQRQNVSSGWQIKPFLSSINICFSLEN